MLESELEDLKKSKKKAKFDDLCKLRIAKYMYQLKKTPLLPPLTNLCTSNETIHTYDTRNRQKPHAFRRRNLITSKSKHHKGPDK